MFSSKQQRDPYPKQGMKPAIAVGTLTSCRLGLVKGGRPLFLEAAGTLQPHREDGSRAAWLWGWGEELGALGNPCSNVDGAGERSGMASASPFGPCIPAASLAEPHTMPFMPVHAAVQTQILVLALGVSTTLLYLMLDVTSPTPACSPKRVGAYLFFKL